MWFDTHAHVYYLKNSLPVDVIKESWDQGVRGILVPGVDAKANSQAIECANLAKHVWAGVGFHPNDCFDLAEDDWSLLTQQVQHAKVLAIGETGLDYYRQQDDASCAIQQESFERHSELAREFNKPLIVHTRAAKQDTLVHLSRCYEKGVGGILHCFSEDLDMAMKAIDYGFYISFSGIITFKNAQELRASLLAVPKDRVLIETDCPFLAPVPHRGHENKPAYVRYVGEKVAELWGMEIPEVQQILFENSLRVLGLSES